MADQIDFDEFVRTRSHRLLRTAFALTGDRMHAEDLLQSSLLSPGHRTTWTIGTWSGGR